MNIPPWATLVLTVCIMCSDINANNSSSEARSFIFEDNNTANTISENIVSKSAYYDPLKFEVGRTINIFPRYGSLILTLKVWPTRFNDWLSREKTMKIFKDGTYHNKSIATIQKPKFDDDFLIDFCDTQDHLLAAYFDHFEIDGISKAFKAFTAFSSSKTLAQALGIHPAYLGNNHRFVLVRLFKRVQRYIIDGDLQLDLPFAEASSKIRIGSSESAHQFMDEYGSHIIVDYEEGDVIYQVFVFGSSVYREMKNGYLMMHKDIRDDLAFAKRVKDIKSYFTPYYAFHVGQVKLASGHPDFLSINEKLKKRYYIIKFYESIFHVLDNSEIEEELLEIEGRAITGMTLKKITKALRPSSERYWLSIILDNTLSLFYATMY